MDAMIFSLHLARISSILGAINFLTTILMNGPKGFSMYNLYLYLYCMAVTVFMLLTTLPVLAARITMILFDRHFNTSFFNVARGRDPILFQHLLRFIVWAHHLFSIRMDTDSKCYFAAPSIVIRI